MILERDLYFSFDVESLVTTIKIRLKSDLAQDHRNMTPMSAYPGEH